jgi:hypothetical protein
LGGELGFLFEAGPLGEDFLAAFDPDSLAEVVTEDDLEARKEDFAEEVAQASEARSF